MQSVVPFDTDASNPRGHRFVVTLTAIRGQSGQVRSCEVITPNYRNRFTFPMRADIRDVFVDDVSSGIADCLAALSDATEVVSLPSLTIEIPGLTLAQAHVMASQAEDGSLSVILRFKFMLGAITPAFRPELGLEDSVNDHNANMSAMVLTDIVMPLLNLCSMAESGGLHKSDAFEDFMNTLIERSEDVRFQAELIKRFVAASAPTAQQPRPVANHRKPFEVVR